MNEQAKQRVTCSHDDACAALHEVEKALQAWRDGESSTASTIGRVREALEGLPL
jgi:hypothetical protein